MAPATLRIAWGPRPEGVAVAQGAQAGGCQHPIQHPGSGGPEAGMASQTSAEEGEVFGSPWREDGIGDLRAEAVGRKQHLRCPKWGRSQPLVLTVSGCH